MRRAHVLAIALAACAPSPKPESKPEPKPATDATGTPAPPRADAEPPPPPTASPVVPRPVEDGGAHATAQRSAPPVDPSVKIVTIGMHVAGGPFDEPTKEPFKKAVEPHFPEIAPCWAKHVREPLKSVDVGVDLLIEASGGKPKVTNPRSTLGKDAAPFVACVVAVFENVDFPKLVDRGRTGVSYSLRFTPKP